MERLIVDTTENQPNSLENRRQACLTNYRLQETKPEDTAFQDLVALAAQLCGMPVAFVSFIDHNKQWFKASVGLSLMETDRQIAFCDHVVRQQSFLEVQDTRQDLRFADNPLVIGLPFIRYYAGMPLFAATGEVLGALAVVDYGPNTLNPDQVAGLQRLARQVEQLLELRKSNLALDAERLKVLEADQTKSRFFAQVSHDLRTPLNGILGMLQVMQHHTLSEEQLESVETIRYSSEQLLRLVNDLLDLQKLDAGKLKIEARPFFLEDVLRPLERTFQWQASQRTLGFQVSSPPEIPPLSGDAHRLGQVLMNLLSNAFKFTKEGEVSLSVEPIEQTEEEICLSFCVADTGMGISLDVQKRLFRAFEQADEGIARKFGGTGLGLSIVKELMQLMGGDIRLESQEGLGSKFIFDLSFPVCQEANTTLKPFIHEPALADAPKYSGRVLVVDDNPVNCLVLRKLLEHEGLVVDIAEDGYQSLLNVKKVNYDLVFMDLQMPVMTGFQATSAIRALREGRDLPIYALTASISAEEREEFGSAGFNGMLEKPIQHTQMIRLLEAYFPITDAKPVLNFTQALKELAEVDLAFQQELVRTAEADFQAMLKDLDGKKGNDAEFIRKLRHKYKATFQLFALQSLDGALENLQTALTAEQESENTVGKLKKHVLEIGKMALTGLASFS